MFRPARRGALALAAALALACLFAVIGPRASLAAGGCVSWEAALVGAEQAREAQGGGARIVVFDGAGAERAMAWINAIPPQTDLSAERILALQRRAGGALVGLLIDGCFRGPVEISEDAWQDLLVAAKGDPA